MKKTEFTQRWITNILASINSQVSEETKVRLMESCGRACAKAEAVNAVDNCRGDCQQLQSILCKWLGKSNVWRKGDTVHLVYSKCYCRLQVDIPDRLSKIFCQCSCGWLKEVFETALKKQVKVDLKSSIRQGAQQCTFEVWV